MDEEIRGWRALPPPLLLGLGLSAIQPIVMTAEFLVGPYGRPTWISLANLGASAAVSALCAYGAAELAQRHTGAQRAGLRIASAAWVAALVLQFVWLAWSVLRQTPWPMHDDVWIIVESYSWLAVELLPAAGLVVATLRRHRVLAVGSGVIAIMSHPPPFASEALARWLELELQGRVLLNGVLAVIGLAAITALVIKLVPATTLPEPGRAAVGLRRAATALRVQMIAVIVGTVTMLSALASSGSSAAVLHKLAPIAGAGVNAAAFVWLAVGLLGAARDGALSRVKLAVAGAISLWCGAVALIQLVFRYSTMYGSNNGWARTYADALTFGVPLIALVGIVILAAELGPFVAWCRHEQLDKAEEAGPFAGSIARRREAQLRRDPTGQLVWIILLMLASTVIQGWVLPNADSPSRVASLMVMAAGCSLVALTMTAQLCAAAAEALGREPGLPAARVVIAG